MDKNTLLSISYVIVPILTGFLGYYIKARQEVAKKRLEWKEKKYSDLVHFMAQFHYRDACIEDQYISEKYEQLEKEKQASGRAWLQNIMHAKIDELWLYAPDSVITEAQKVQEILDTDCNKRREAVEQLIIAMKNDLGNKTKLKWKFWTSIPNEHQEAKK